MKAFYRKKTKGYEAMKKKLLFVMESLRIGGAEKSLVTLLSMMDTSKYEIDLYLFRQRGEFMEQLPKGINLLDEDVQAKYFQEDFKTAWVKYFLCGDWRRSWHSLHWLIGCAFQRLCNPRNEYYGWQHLKKIYTNQQEVYDVAIGYLEKKSTYYIVDCVNASVKVAFMHTDYDAIPHDKKLDELYFKNLDGLAVVSEHTKDTMEKHFPFMKNKIHVVKNMVSSDVIRHMAEEEIEEFSSCNPNTIKIVTVGRLTLQKNIDGAIDILDGLRKNGLDAEWFVIGEGEEHVNLEQKIKSHNLESKFHLLGSKVNPYPYMKKCDIYVQPSRWEGYGITVAEAKTLGKPIVASDIPEFNEQLIDGVTGRIAKTEEDFVSIITELVKEPEQMERLTSALSKEVIKHDELNKFYKMIS